MMYPFKGLITKDCAMYHIENTDSAARPFGPKPNNNNMIMNRFLSVLIVSLLSNLAFIAKADLNIAIASDFEEGFEVGLLTRAKIRLACLEVHGEKWYKENMILSHKYRFGWVVFNNQDRNAMQISSVRVGVKELVDLKKALDYMAHNDDTLYVSRKDINRLRSDPSYLLRSLGNNWRYDRCLLNPDVNMLRVGKFPIMNDSLLIYDFELQLRTINMTSDPFYKELMAEYREKCKAEGYEDLSKYTFRYIPETSSEKEIDLFFRYFVAQDRHIVDTFNVKRSFPLDIHYEPDTKSVVKFMMVVEMERGRYPNDIIDIDQEVERLLYEP